jgi:serine phosphatase RsbU (regulator of sigma subunit)
MVIAINNARAHHERLEQEKTRKELELAASIQQSLLPAGPPKCNGLQIESFYQPCREVGGDIFDFMYLPDDRLGIVLADVSGKGVPAALITSALHAYLHALVEHYSSPAEFCNVLNRLMCGSLPQASYATMVFIEFTPANGLVRYCSCGHLPILFISHKGVETHGPTGTVMGLMPKASYKDNTVTLPPGGKLLLYTDGLTEASPDDEEEVEEPREFSLKRLQDICEKAQGDHSDLLDLLKTEVETFTEGTQQRDDMTMLSMQYLGD